MKLIYRPEIDGLRAVAVLGVILYHAEKIAIGGFLGVDVFFVISGYLITLLILKEIAVNGSFSFRDFYERRARRILPALFAVMFVTAPFAWIYLTPNPFIDYAKSLISSLLFSSNIYFWLSGGQYAGEMNLLKPLLHTWSLSVEEQFYILYPLILLLCIKYFKKYLTVILFGGLISSLLLADWGSRSHPAITFYILPTRAWELLAGAVLAQLEIDYGRTSYKIFHQSLPALGLILIIHSIIFFEDRMFHPSFYTVSPVIGSMLIIWFTNKEGLVSTILSSKLFVGIGLISYSLYLWHYPIFAFSRTYGFPDSGLWKMSAGLLILCMSVLTYFYVERPFRNKMVLSNKVLVRTIFSSSVVLVILCSTVVIQNGFYERWPELARGMFKKNFSTAPYLTLHDGHGSCFERYDQDFCSLNKKGKKGKIYFVGNSDMASISSNLYEKVLERDFHFTSMTAGGCWYLPNFNPLDPRNKCNSEFQNKRRQHLLSSANSIVLLGGMPLVMNESSWLSLEGIAISEVIALSIKELLKDNRKVVLIYPVPDVDYNVRDLLKKSILRGNFSIKNLKTTSYGDYLERTKNIFEILDSIQHPDLYRVYPHKLFCDNQIKDRCVTHNEKDIFYVDTSHPSVAGAEMIAELIVKEIDKILSTGKTN